MKFCYNSSIVDIRWKSRMQKHIKEYRKNDIAHIMKSGIFLIFLIFFAFLGLFMGQHKIIANAEELVICIDAGHGGSNLGATFQGQMEKDATLVIAKAMEEELNKYSGIRVVMTRTDDAELSLTERAKLAKKENADFLFCLHLNASEYHKAYGAEVWTSAYGKYYAYGKSFGEIVLMELHDTLGIDVRRGVKTKVGTDGKSDYYGIIDYARQRDIPAVIIEHCHMDENRDSSFWNTEESLKELGKADATAVAKYYGLKSKAKESDFGSYNVYMPEIPQDAIWQDVTAPELCEIQLIAYDAGGQQVKINVKALDNESEILYYRYTTDGSYNWSKYYPYEISDYENDSMTVILPMAKWNGGQIQVRVYNQYDLFTYSNMVYVK